MKSRGEIARHQQEGTEFKLEPRSVAFHLEQKPTIKPVPNTKKCAAASYKDGDIVEADGKSSITFPCLIS